MFAQSTVTIFGPFQYEDEHHTQLTKMLFILSTLSLSHIHTHTHTHTHNTHTLAHLLDTTGICSITTAAVSITFM